MVAVLATLIAAPAGSSSPGLAVGAVENNLLWNTADTVSVARYLGLRTIVVSLEWEPRHHDLEPDQISGLTRAVTAAGSLRIVLGIHNNWMRAPVDAPSRQQYCEYASNALRRFPQINDIILWNEPNVGFFWRPQFDDSGASQAPRGYFELAAQCYDTLHAVRPDVNIVGPVNSHWGNDNPNAFSNVSHSPPRFIRELAAVYRASGRTRPLFDTLGHHPYPRSSDEHPSTKHADEAVISIGDTERLLAVMKEAFGGTAQPIPQNGLPIWYLETGYQTRINPDKAGIYDGGFENWPGPVPDVAPGAAVDQAKQLTDSVRLMFCQAHVEAIFNFLLKDEREMAGWQSGVFWADGSPKGSLDAYRSVISEVNEGRVNCGAVPGAGAPAVTTAAARTPASARPTGATEQPKAVRSVTNIAYRGTTRAPFGKLRLRAQLTRGSTASDVKLRARQMTFEVGKDTYLTTTDADGFASVTPSPPTRPGTYRVEIRFRGDELSLGSGARVTVHVVNSRGRVASRGRLRLSPKLSATLTATSNGTRVRGTLALLTQGASRRTVRLTALGLLSRRRIAWLSGTDGRNRYDVHIEPAGRRGRQVQIWRNNVPLHAAAGVPATRLRITRG